MAVLVRSEKASAAERLRAPPVAIFLWSRLLIWASAVFVWIWFEPRPGLPPEAKDLGYATEVWYRADAAWFVSIAEHGYAGNGSAAFYPLYPLSVGLVGRAFGGLYVTAGVVVSLAACLGAFVLLHRLALPRLGADGARRTVLYLALFPMALYLQAVYCESLYLLCCLGAFTLAERRRWLPAGSVTGLAMLTRVAGVALLPALAVMAWRSPERQRALASLAVAPLIWALYPLWLQLELHAPRAEFAAQAAWGRHLSYAGPLAGLWHGLQAAWAGIEQVATGDATRYWPHAAAAADPLRTASRNLEDFAFLAVFAWLGVLAWRRFGAPYGLFVLGSLAVPLSAPTSGYPLLSMPRFCLPLFPAFMALAAITVSPRRERTVLAASSLLLGAVIVEWVAGQWVS
ncbi:MAG TPA: mannosyltransferase family protein [Gaiellaceae bacterium]|nr:mannosyltransferase family protein [Gaiellaceae bacterium]